MRISDWSSDVCSSDLQDVGRDRLAQRLDAVRRGIAVMSVAQRLAGGLDDMLGRLEVRLADAEVDDVPPLGRQRRGSGKDLDEIARASCRDRVCQYVSSPVVTESLKKKQHIN